MILIIIIIIIIMIFSMRLRRWHLRTADCRYLAERFRILCYSYPLALRPSGPHLPAHYRAESSGWLEWHTLAILRLTPMPTAKVARTYLDEYYKTMHKWVRGQIHYHHRNAEKLERMDRAIHRLAWVSIGVAFLAALSAWKWHSTVQRHDLEPWLLFLTAGLPAASAAAHAISAQGEFPKLIDRSRTMVRLLRSSLNRLRPREASTAAGLRRQTDYLAQALLDEVADWQVLYRKPPPPPG